MRLWKASTATRTQNRPLISRQRAEPLLSFFASAAGAAGPSGPICSLVSGIESLSLLLQLAGGQDHECLRPWVIVGHRQMNVDCVAFRRKCVKPRLGSAGQL